MSESNYLQVPRAGLEPANHEGIQGNLAETGESAGGFPPPEIPEDPEGELQEGTQLVPLGEGLPEVAWDGDGRWCGDGPAPAGGIPLLGVPHVRSCGGGSCGTFVCFWCRRAVPWCFGAGGDDGLDGRLCDDCWYELHEDDEPGELTGLARALDFIAGAASEQP